MLNGLTSVCGPFKTSICTRASHISIEELHVLLLCKELNLENSQDSIPDYSTTTLISSKQSSGPGNGLVEVVVLKLIVDILEVAAGLEVVAIITEDAVFVLPGYLLHGPVVKSATE